MTSITKFTAQSGQFVKAHTPEILAGVGVAGVITAGVLAARATLKLEGLVEKLERARGRAHDRFADGLSDDKELKKELFVAQRDFVLGLVKLYGIPASIGAAGIGALLGGQGVLKKRNVALVGAYSSLDQAYREYRKRVVAAVGEEREAEIRLVPRDAETDFPEGSSETKDRALMSEEEQAIQALGASEYAVFFDKHTSPNWSPNPDTTMATLRSQERFANDRLVSRGYLFLNEVFEALGMEKTKAGQFVGWYYTDAKMAEGDNYVDFGLNNFENVRRGASLFDEEGHVLLDFNVDGLIIDKVWKKH